MRISLFPGLFESEHFQQFQSFHEPYLAGNGKRNTGQSLTLQSVGETLSILILSPSTETDRTGTETF